MHFCLKFLNLLGALLLSLTTPIILLGTDLNIAEIRVVKWERNSKANEKNLSVESAQPVERKQDKIEDEKSKKRLEDLQQQLVKA